MRLIFSSRRLITRVPSIWKSVLASGMSSSVAMWAVVGGRGGDRSVEVACGAVRIVGQVASEDLVERGHARVGVAYL